MSNGEKGIHAIEKNNKNQENKKIHRQKFQVKPYFLMVKLGVICVFISFLLDQLLVNQPNL
nr:hypothetical protein [Bacillus velezensis]MDH3104084.1 hypothetical protein [Bacillus velezensis]MDH3139012.1 hypothetical protein [Bacillus velezensis]